MIRGDLPVRLLAEFTCRSGDLYPSRQGRAVDAEEGIAAQRELQTLRLAADSNYQREVAVGLVFQTLLGERKLRGRIDGLSTENDALVVEEIKCRGVLPEQVDPVDFAQALIYAGMLALQNDAETPHYKVRVVYVHADTRQTAEFTKTLEQAVVAGCVQFMLLCLVCRLQRHYERNQSRLEWAAQLQFPMQTFRTAQQTLARRVYQALTKQENLLLEAPTGSGKSLAVLFPAAKAQQLEEQLFFLTSRNAGAEAALMACRQIDPLASQWVVVELTAKAKVCLNQGVACEPENCPLATGYYDRVKPAVDALLEHKYADRKKIEQVAGEHQVCPFELSLDLALWADVIVGDYNYVFDPVVRLKRFAEHRQLHLLVDESHQLSPRVSDMLTVRFDRTLVRDAKSTADDVMKKKVMSIDRALLALKRVAGEGEQVLCGPHHVQDQAQARLDSLQRACTRLLETAAEQEIELSAHPQLQMLIFAASRWLRSEQWISETEFVHIVESENSAIRVSRVCLDPGPYLERIFAGHGAVVRFSGTVTPLPLYQRLHGQPAAVAERAQNPFQAEQAEVLVIRDIDTYFNQREASLPKLVQFLVDLLDAKSGRYLVALPSFSYLSRLTSALASTDILTLEQTPGLDQVRSGELLDQLRALDRGIICIVMGGVLSESVDFSGISLQGVVMVGLGLPPPSLERDLMAQFFEQAEGPGWGQMVAYTQPALVKNLQAAGRLIRSPEDFGVICLVDPRFSAPHVQRFFPVHWHPRIIAAADVQQQVKQFWQTTADHKESDLQ